MKHTTLTPPLKSLNIAIVSAILGLGAASTANAQSVEYSISSIGEDNQGKMVFGDTFFVEDQKTNGISMKFYSDSEKTLPNSMLFDQILTNQILNGFKEGQPFIPVDKDGKIISQKDQLTENGVSKDVRSVTTKIATADDVANSPYAHGIQKDIDDLYSFDQEVTDRIATLDRATEILTEAGNHHDELIRKNKSDIEDLIAYTHLNDENDQQQTEAIDALNKASSENTQNIEDLAAYNELQDAYAKQQTEAIDALNKASAANKADADAKFKGVQTDIANNKITLANHAKKINDNQKAIEAKLGGKVDLQKLAELKTSVDKNQADIADNINNIHELAQQQDQHGSDIRTLAKAGITNKDAIAKNTQSITTLDNKVNTFDGRISALDAKVNGFDGRINALDDKVENSMAAQAALNGLFQPYNVGKVSVSAAVGAYGSKSAIAVGAGYRVNPHLAFKGGAAINTSGSRKGSYNLGINYEF